MTHHEGEIMKPLVRMGKTPADCWQWLGRIGENGYGKKQYCNRTLSAHRWLWIQLFGPIAEGLVINHKCQNRQCVNPVHLEVVTQAENMRHGITTTLTPNDVVEIKRAKKDRTLMTRKVLAERYGVTPMTISDIWNGHSWKKPKPFYGPKKYAPTKIAESKSTP